MPKQVHSSRSRAQQKKYKRLSTAERLALVAQTISLAQLRFSMQQVQIVAKVRNTQLWEDIGKGLLEIYHDGREAFASREAVERYVKAKEEAARELPRVPRAMPGRKGVQPPAKRKVVKARAVPERKAVQPPAPA